jgi:hypothetical protein
MKGISKKIKQGKNGGKQKKEQKESVSINKFINIIVGFVLSIYF